MKYGKEQIIKMLPMVRLSGGWKFLLIVIGIYLILSFRYKYLVLEGVIGTIVIFGKILPVLLLVFAIMFITNVLIGKGLLRKIISRQDGLKGYFYAVVSGVLISGPPYILYPLLGDLKKEGMKNSLIAVFLFNRNVKIPFFPVMIFYFGLSFTVVMSIFIILFSLLNGYLVGLFTKE